MYHPSTRSLRSPNRKGRKAGFALIVTLSLMILVTVVAVGLLSLSSISLRASSQSSDMLAARSNARLAMMLAIGDLQKFAGPDTRITARADVLDEKNPPVTGVWKSWEGTDHQLTGAAPGRPVSPGNYQTKKQERFLSWLVSGEPSAGTTLPNTAKGDSQSGAKAILLGDRSVGTGAAREKLQIHLKPTLIAGNTHSGGFAWWVSGENQKARLPKPYDPTDDGAARWSVLAKSHAIADTKPFRMEGLLTDPSPALKGISLKQSDIFGKADILPVSQEFFHDLSTSSVGLLTNVATGGWKKDLSLLTENWSTLGTANLPFFRLSPGQDVLSSMPTTGNPTAAKSMIYPWSSYRGGGSDIAIYRHGAVSSWENLKDYALLYRDSKMTTTSTGKARITPFSVANDVTADADVFSFLHRVRILPVIARIQWVFSHTAGTPPPPAAGQPAWPAGSLEPRLLLTPVVTMWNPYNVEMSFSQVPLLFKLSKPLPAALRYTVNGVQNAKYNSPMSGNTNNSPALSSSSELRYQINGAFTLKPGETRVFSPLATAVSADLDPATNPLELQPGFRSRGGHYFALKNDADARMVVPGTASIKAEAHFDTTYDDVPKGSSATLRGVGIFLDMLSNGKRALAYRMVYSPTVAADIYKPLSGLAASPALSSTVSNPVPFMTTVFGARMASRTHLAAKGFVQSSPLVNYTAMGGKDLVEQTIQRHYGGTNHPVNSPFDYSFDALSASDSLYPNSDSTNRSYIVTGFTKADGLSRCVIDELPLRPLQSLAELQNWDLRYENPIPPFGFNLIGNSDAAPLISASSVTGSYSDAVNLQHDDSYCANHLLFDDWIFSSIAPDPTNYGTAGKSLQKTYTDFVSGVSPLGNRAYQAVARDAAFAAGSSSNATTLFNSNVNKPDSWKTIASRLEVEGMFNVNSTSVTAWRALLGHARNQKIPYIKDSSSGWSIDLSGKTDHAFSRFSVAGDSEAKSQGSSGSFPEAAEFAGYRILDDNTLDALASEIVKQVRLRGPFLSLSEFVNRQLSSGDLALAGTIQSALNELASKSSTSPYTGITNVISRVSSADPPPAGTSEYQFPAAAVGQSTYGLPGWTRQADVLRPLAPILTARDDTFTIRAYGDTRDKTGKIKATATCEAVVRRTREYVDPTDLAEITTLPTKAVNKTFGRRYELVSFRWLDQGEL
ncbi:MAG: hypothetical protein ABIT37_12250 [Luteolibacter sp.]